MATDTITAVITGDNHLGTYYARLRPDRLQSRREALQTGFQRAVDTALEEKADLFLIVGDLFDRPDPRNADRNFVAAQLCRLRDAGVQTVAICGNHDSPRLVGYDGGIVPLHEMAALGGLHLMRGDTAWESLSFGIPTGGGGSVSVRIRGRSYDFRQAPGECPLAEDASLAEARAAVHEIVLLHYGVEGWQPFENEPILKRENLDLLGADVIAVGHLHARNQARLPGGALLLNPGATERMDWGEERLKTGCAVVRLSEGEAAKLEWHDFSPQPMQTLTINATDLDAACADFADSTTAATDWVTGRIEDALAEAGVDAAQQMLRLRVEGMASEATFHQLDLDAVRRFGTARSFHLEIDAEGLAVRYADGEIADVSGGFEIDTEIEAVVAALLAQAKPGEGATDAERVDAARREVVLQGAKDALLSAYQRIQPGS